MATYIYTYHESRRGAYTRKAVHIYRVCNGRPAQKVAEMCATFTSEWHLVMDAAEAAKLWPRKVFERHPSGGYRVAYADELRRQFGITISRVV